MTGLIPDKDSRIYFHPGIKFNKENPKRPRSLNLPPTKSLAGVLKNSHFTCAKEQSQPGQELQQAAELAECRVGGLQITKQLQLENTLLLFDEFSVKFSFTQEPAHRSALDVLKSITLCPPLISQVFPPSP